MALPDPIALFGGTAGVRSFGRMSAGTNEAYYLDTGSTLVLPRSMTIKQTLGSRRGSLTVDRSLLQFSNVKNHAVTGLPSKTTVNLTIDRDRSGAFVTADLYDVIILMASFVTGNSATSPIGDSAKMDKILQGFV